MAEVSNELSYEVLKAMRVRVGNIEQKLGEIGRWLVQIGYRIGSARHFAE